MNKYILHLSIFIWSVSSFATSLPSSYTLTNADYELVGNGKYDNFDIRSNGAESDPYVILQKIDQILFSHFTSSEGNTVKVFFDTYDGESKQSTNWDLYVENSRFRTSEYILTSSYNDLGTTSTLDISTWNIEFYPKNSTSQSKVVEIIINSKIDVFGLQEIGSDNGGFAELLSTLGNDFGGYISDPANSYDQNVAFIYRKEEVTLVTPGRVITELENNDAFPRTPIEIVFKHNSGFDFVVINNHLKCCDGSEDRRRLASEKLKKYIDDKYKTSNTKVVLLGDLNDRIDSDETDVVFQNFIDDADNYVFVDKDVSEATKDGPGWANIDHILINKPLFKIYDKPAKKLKGENFDYNYDSFVSDHFPVWVNLNTELLSNEINYVYKSGLEIYPNPCSKNIITIKLIGNIKKANVSVIDLEGKVVISKEISLEHFDISSLQKGIYIITLTNNGVLYTGKFVKK